MHKLGKLMNVTEKWVGLQDSGRGPRIVHDMAFLCVLRMHVQTQWTV